MKVKDTIIIESSSRIAETGADVALLEADPRWVRLEELLAQAYALSHGVDLMFRVCALRERLAEQLSTITR